MRIVDQIPHESMTISIFQMNDKFMVKFEAGMMEQCFKFFIEEVKSIEGVKAKIDETFILRTRQRFNDMFLQLKESTS